MAEVKPLRLKAQRISKKVEVAELNPVAQISVDTGVFHLPDIFDYLVPKALSEVIVPGVFVEIPFGSREVSGYVVSRNQSNLDYSKLKFIKKTISPIPLLSEELLEIVTDTSNRYACKPWDVIRSAIPPRMASAEKDFVGRELSQSTSSKLKLSHKLTISADEADLNREISEAFSRLTESQQLLVIVPDERDIKQLIMGDLPITPIVLSTELAKSDRYLNYLTARFDAPKLIIGTRSAIFTPLNQNSKIFIFNDNDESMYERRSPGWNVRDIALLRSGDHSLHFIGASPSLEIVRLAELGWIAREKKRDKYRTKEYAIHFPQSRVSDIAVIKAGLKLGNVLVVMAETGYITAIACQKCRNQAKCECGGKLHISSRGAIPQCMLCEKYFQDWKCAWCDSENIRSIGKGSNRYAEEIAKAVPGYRVALSKGGARVDVLPVTEENILVISSYGCEPKGNYSAVVLKSLENLTNRVDLRSLEFARRCIFENLNRMDNKKTSSAFIDLPVENPISQAILRNDVYGLCLAEIDERNSSLLPPSVRIATLIGEGSAIRQLAKQFEDNALFTVISTIKFSDSSNTGASLSKMILRSEIAKSADFSEFFYDLARYRGIKGLSPIQIHLDPFSI